MTGTFENPWSGWAAFADIPGRFKWTRTRLRNGCVRPGPAGIQFGLNRCSGGNGSSITREYETVSDRAAEIHAATITLSGSDSDLFFFASAPSTAATVRT